MDLRHVCHLVAETLKLSGGTLLGEDAGAVDGHVALVGEDSGTVLLTVECREYEVGIRERKRRADPPGDPAYRRVRLRGPFQHGAIAITSLAFALVQQGAEGALVHVRGECGGSVAFAGCITPSEGRDVPAHDLRVFGGPLDLAELAVAVNLLLAGSLPGGGGEMHCSHE